MKTMSLLDGEVIHMELQTMYAEYEYRRQITAIANTNKQARVSIWRRIMG